MRGGDEAVLHWHGGWGEEGQQLQQLAVGRGSGWGGQGTCSTSCSSTAACCCSDGSHLPSSSSQHLWPTEKGLKSMHQADSPPCPSLSLPHPPHSLAQHPHAARIAGGHHVTEQGLVPCSPCSALPSHVAALPPDVPPVAGEVKEAIDVHREASGDGQGEEGVGCAPDGGEEGGEGAGGRRSAAAAAAAAAAVCNAGSAAAPWDEAQVGQVWPLRHVLRHPPSQLVGDEPGGGAGQQGSSATAASQAPHCRQLCREAASRDGRHCGLQRHHKVLPHYA